MIDGKALKLREGTAALETGKFILPGRGLTEWPEQAFAPPAVDAWWLAEPLREVDLSSNRISAIPDAIGTAAESLTTLRLSDNRVHELNPALFTCAALKLLDLSDNEVTTLPDAVAGWASLVHLDLSRNKLTSLPPTLSLLPRLEVLRLAGNGLTDLPPDLGRYVRLQELDASHNALAALPPSLAACPTLRSMQVSHNQLTDAGVGDVLARCTALIRLDMRHNRLTRVPMLPPAPSECFLGHNRIHSSPTDVVTLARPSLHVLDLSDNAITGLPPEAVASWVQMTTLDVRNNDLATLPPGIGHLPALVRCAVEGNPLRTLRRALITGPTAELKAYLRTRGEAGEGMVHAAAVPAHPTSVIAIDAARPTSSSGGAGMRAGARPGGGSSTTLYPTPAGPDPHASAWSAATRDAVADGKLVLSPFAFSTPLPTSITLTQLDGGSGSGVSHLLPRLRVLVVDGLPLSSPTALPPSLLSAAPGLEVLSMCKCGLTALPPALSSGQRWPAMPALHTLHLSNNRLVHHDMVGLLPPSLRELDLSHNALPIIPTGLPTATPHLTTLRLDFNGFPSTRSDDAALDLPRLTTLTLQGNRLNAVPLVLTTLPSLATLDIRDNDIAHLPPQIGTAPALRVFMAEGNPQRTVRHAIMVKGSSAVLEYLRCRASDATVEGGGPVVAAMTATSSSTRTACTLPAGAGGSGSVAPVHHDHHAPLPTRAIEVPPTTASSMRGARVAVPLATAGGGDGATPALSLTALERELEEGGGSARSAAETQLLKRKIALMRAQVMRAQG